MQVILLFNTIDKIYNLVVILSFVSLVTEWRYLCRRIALYVCVSSTRGVNE